MAALGTEAGKRLLPRPAPGLGRWLLHGLLARPAPASLGWGLCRLLCWLCWRFGGARTLAVRHLYRAHLFLFGERAPQSVIRD